VRIYCKKYFDHDLTRISSSQGSAVDAVEMAIKILENSGHTNAGYGSNLTWDGKVECEAGIFESVSGNFGGCTCVTDVKNPISLARKICDKQSSLFNFGRLPPMMVAAGGASQLAKEMGVEMVASQNDLISKKAQNTFNYYRRKITEYEHANLVQVSPLDTVGAIAIDDYGNVASGCSSGGIVLKLAGRVGQAAIYGAGCWSQKLNNQSLATVTTGNGEYLIKTLLAREICMNLMECECPTTKLYQVFNEKFLKSPVLPRNQEYYAGCLAVDYRCLENRGDLLWAHTTKMLCLGYKSSNQKFAKFVTSSLPDHSQAGHKVIVGGISF
jgi:taspase (threonine aspartase 1)